MLDRYTGVLLFAGLGCFGLAFVLSAVYPWMITDGTRPEASIEAVATPVTTEFKQLKESYPVAFAQAFPRADECLTDQELVDVAADDPRRTASDGAWGAAHAVALRAGRDEYVGQVCWHCHSQFVRPVANEAVRFGRVRSAADDNNELQRPVLWGTRRVGPDLTNEGGRRSNDWHVAHFWDPEGTSPDSVMPRYTWFFRDGFQVVRGIDPELAARQGLSSEREYAYPGVFETQAEAEAELARIRESADPNLKAETARLRVVPAKGPDGDGLAIIAYLQWLGTWDASEREETNQ